MSWLIYGANGYTAGLVLEQALLRGHRPMLAARREETVRPLAEASNLAWKAFSLEDPFALDAALEGVTLVAHLAGPYQATAKPMFEACLRRGVHYVDIGGEVAVYEALHARTEEARAAGIVAVPGVGFDVVPSDCVALMLKDALPDATELELAFGGFGKSMASRGTLKTMVQTMGVGALVRIGGALTQVSVNWRQPTIAFPQGTLRCVTVPWGEVVTAFVTTKIPNVCVYMGAPAGVGFFLTLMKPLLQFSWVRRVLTRLVDATLVGPGVADRTVSSAAVWGRVRNAAGATVEVRLRAPEGYTTTAASTVSAIERVLAGRVSPGVWTPAAAFGKDFVRSLPGVQVDDFTRSP